MFVTTHTCAVTSGDEFGAEADHLMTAEHKRTIRNIYMEHGTDTTPVTALPGDGFINAIMVS